MTTRQSLVRTWLWLCGLSLLSTALSLVVAPSFGPGVAGLAILGLAWLKAHLVIARYMGLATAPAWLRGFDIVLTLFVGLLAALHLAALSYP